MPGARSLALTAAVGFAVAAYFSVWFGWPTFVAVGIGATMAVVLLLVSASLADDPAAADAAWRAAAPDLAARERGGRAPDDGQSADAEPGS